MSTLSKKIDFVVLVSANMANPNGDPMDGNRPRTTYDGHGIISDVCIKRKLRNRMQDMDCDIFVQSEDRCDDGCTSLSARASKYLGECKDGDAYVDTACSTWLDTRSFGQLFAFKAKGGKKGEDSVDAEGISRGVRGPVSVQHAMSVSPVEIVSMQITKSVNGEDAKTRSSDTMGTKHMVRYGLYVVKGSINVQLAEKTGFTDDDAEIIKECLQSLFTNDASSARPDGSMEVVKVYWFTHNSKLGQYSTAKVHRSVKVALKDGVVVPTCPEDYVITREELPGLECEELDGM